ncbi:auxin-induced protein 15A-like [Cucurbita pepo subsp. pepo]|uniref:Auxin-induced protein 15A n=1 Tax=Cucurbita moschata TaxID=3662 RepID=A0A6J1EDQ2_CUCMO|nr:auxin-induced protein 15A [Cucurbita moschata]XP_023544813.1 auxin-induced protein 15A-like [Cucurbita pepo subsp. pepo]XP_023544814.1 auxin-induced protein 15A-like [Cucurbita pepo subsp. pepo]
MLGKKMVSFKKLAKKVKVRVGTEGEASYNECLLRDQLEPPEDHDSQSPSSTPTGSFAIYVGDERQRFVVPTSFLSHPLFRMLLDKAYREFGFEQRNALMVPCSVSAFQEIVSAVECCNGRFDFGELVEEFL